MAYRTVFDIATAGYQSWPFPAFGLLFVAISAFFVAKRTGLPGWRHWNPRVSRWFALFGLGFSVLRTLIAFALTYGEYSMLVKSVDKAHVVEGVVTNFKPMPVTGHAMERFCVSGACFEYSDYVVVGGFNNAASHGGPIREGLRVRVTHVGNSILKLEVAE